MKRGISFNMLHANLHSNERKYVYLLLSGKIHLPGYRTVLGNSRPQSRFLGAPDIKEYFLSVFHINFTMW